jgi:hypothetical protein
MNHHIKNKIQAFEAASDIVLGCLISGKQEHPGEIVSKSFFYNALK